MKICVAGWYFRPKFLLMLKNSGFETFVVMHRDGDTHGLPSMLYPNIGLEFGCYRSYVEDHWDGVSDVLFVHDDVELSDTVGLHDVASLAGIGVEQAYIFHNENDELVNGGAHGRAIWIRGDILKKLAADFPLDENNVGKNIGIEAQKGILRFHREILKCGQNTAVIAIVPQFEFAHRGRLHDNMFVYRKQGAHVPGGLVNVSE